MKTHLLLSFAVALILSAFAIPTTSYAKGFDIGVKSIHIDDSQALPNNAASRSATYKIDLHIEGKSALSALAISLPEELSVGSVEVTDGTGKLITANATIKDKKIAITFNSPVSSESYLQVRLLNASTRWNYGNTWFLPVSATVDGISTNLPLGLARIQTYSH